MVRVKEAARSLLAATLLLAGGCGSGGADEEVPTWPAARLLGSLPASCRWAAAVTGEGLGPFPLPFFLGRGNPPWAVGGGPHGWTGICPARALTPPVSTFAGRDLFLHAAGGESMAWSNESDVVARAAARSWRGEGDSPAIRDNRVWPELVRALSRADGEGLLWVDLARLRRDLVAEVDRRGRDGSVRPLAGLVLDQLNLESFAALLLRCDEAGRCRGGVRLWPDRVGLGHLLTAAAGGLEGVEEPGDEGGWACWRIHPPALWGMVEGLRSAPGMTGQALTRGLAAITRTTGLDPRRDLVGALAGPVALRYRGGSFRLELQLRPGEASDRLRRAAASLAPLGRTVGLGGGVEGDRLILSRGKVLPAPPRPRPAAQADQLGAMKLPLEILGLAGGALRLRFIRSEYGLALAGRVEAP